MEFMNSINKKSQKNAIETDELKVMGNLISWDNTIVQISNVSAISTSNVAKEPFPVITIVLVIIGLLILSFNKTIGWLLILTSIAGGVIWFERNRKLNKLKKLTFILNSGNTFALVFHDKTFLKKVSSVLTEILINDNRNAHITFNIKNNTFSNDSSIINSK